MPPPNFYTNGILKDSWHKAEVGVFPRLTLLPHRMHVSFRNDSRGSVAYFLFPPCIAHSTRCGLYYGLIGQPRAGTDWTEGVRPKACTRKPSQTPTVQSVPALGLLREDLPFKPSVRTSPSNLPIKPAFQTTPSNHPFESSFKSSL